MDTTKAELEQLIAEQVRDSKAGGRIQFEVRPTRSDALYEAVYFQGWQANWEDLLYADPEGTPEFKLNGSRVTLPEIPHGTIGGYSNHKCRCSRCKKVWADYHRNHPNAKLWRANRKRKKQKR